MLDPEAKERLVEQFRACLDSDADDAADDEGELIDLSTLLAEMAALKNEVRLQARQFKSALEQTQALSDALAGHNQALVRDLERARAQAAEAKAQAERGLLLGLLELRDRLQAGLDAQTAWRPSPLLRLLSRLLGDGQRHSRSLREGSALTLQRLDELLASHRVRPIAALGQALDPQCMQAVGIEWAPEAAEGVVLRELRRGFQQGAVLLRTAEVIVNKKGPAP
jgi:molecular chaperone GrpE